MYIQRNQSKNSKTGKVYTSVLLCSKYREGKKVKTRTEANLSHFPENIVLGIENMLKSEGETTVCLKDMALRIVSITATYLFCFIISSNYALIKFLKRRFRQMMPLWLRQCW